ncbi:hypothetical protein [Azospirillum ramasamyi]|uniref:hypothetical protein n=1 Tax=Azospirillum ramasamyi TaxID=682998 RepID=UPI00159C4D73|nr:hypothetical protein [Azospirillum ramasamyi]
MTHSLATPPPLPRRRPAPHTAAIAGIPAGILAGRMGLEALWAVRSGMETMHGD